MNIKKITAVIMAGAVLASTITGCGINKNAVAAKLDDQEISLGLVNFMCKYQQAVYDDTYSYYASMYGVDDMWNTDLSSSGSTTWESLRDNVVENVHEFYTLKAHMSDYDVEITDDEETEIADTAKAFMEANSDEAIKELGATEEIVEEMLTLYTIKNKMHEAIIADADTEVSDEEANMRAYSYIEIDTDSYTDDSGNTVEYTDDEKVTLQTAAALMASEVEAGTSLEDVADEYSYTVSTGTYDADDDTIDSNLKTALDALSEGETTELVTSDSALYIARLDSECDEEATESNRESIISERQEDLYDETLSGWQDKETWKVYDKQIEKIVIDNNFTQQTESTETESADTTEAVETTTTEAVETTATEAVETTEAATETVETTEAE